MTTLPADLERVLAEAAECRVPGVAANLLATWLRNNLLDVREALADAERFEWLYSHAPGSAYRSISVHYGEIANVRNAIDKARAQEAGQ